MERTKLFVLHYRYAGKNQLQLVHFTSEFIFASTTLSLLSFLRSMERSLLDAQSPLPL